MDISNKRKQTKEIILGQKKLGAANPILVQSMIKSKFSQEVLLKTEIRELISAGCEVVRIAVTDRDSIFHIKSLIKEGYFNTVPLVADIQFDYKLALLALEAGVHCVR